MVNKRPGYWDVDGCQWVGIDPSEVQPIHADEPASAAGADTAAVPDLPSPRFAVPADRTAARPGQPVS